MAVIDSDLCRMIESQLYNYLPRLDRYSERRDEILHGVLRPERGSRRVAGKSDPTAQKGMKLAELDEGKEKQWLDVISRALQTMPQHQKELVALKYFRCIDNQQVISRLHIGRSRFYEWRKDIIVAVALVAAQRGLLDNWNDKNAFEESESLKSGRSAE